MLLSNLIEDSLSSMATVMWSTQDLGQTTYAGYLESHHFPRVAQYVNLPVILCCSAHY